MVIRICFDPVPYHCAEGEVIYWEYEIEEYYQTCMISVQQFAAFLEGILQEAVDSEAVENIHLVFEEGRIKVWLPFSRFSDDLFRQVGHILRDRLSASFEEIL